jgi:beta-1,4-mannosyltransferase
LHQKFADGTKGNFALLIIQFRKIRMPSASPPPVFGIVPWNEQSTNPYQRLTAQGLEAIGVQVTKIPYSPFNPLSKALQGTPADVLLLDWVHSFYTSPGLASTLVKTLAGALDRHKIRDRTVPIIWNIHNLHRHDNRHRQLEQWSFRQLARAVDGIRVFNEGSIPQVRQYLALPASTPIRYIPHGNYTGILGRDPHLDLSAHWGIDPDDWVLLIPGALREGKGIIPFVKTFCAYHQKMRNPRLKLVIAGSPQTPTLAHALREVVGTHPAVRLHLHYIPDAQLLNFLDLARFVVLPYENMLNSGMAALALSAGKPVLASELFAGHFPENLVFTGKLTEVQSLGTLLERAQRTDQEEIEKEALAFAKTLEWRAIAEKLRIFGAELSNKYPTRNLA